MISLKIHKQCKMERVIDFPIISFALVLFYAVMIALFLSSQMFAIPN